MNIRQLKETYSEKQKEITARLNEFRNIWDKGTEENVLSELMFCILTPQSKAYLCWDAITRITEKKILLSDNYNKILKELTGVRFKYKKTNYLINARKLFIKNKRVAIKKVIRQFKDVYELREWLVKNIKGIGLKEASHFLRNIGFGDDITILDRHILRNLKLFRVIEDIPETLTKQTYYEIENKMKKFAGKIEIPLSHLDLLFWCKETGTIFK